MSDAHSLQLKALEKDYDDLIKACEKTIADSEKFKAQAESELTRLKKLNHPDKHDLERIKSCEAVIQSNQGRREHTKKYIAMLREAKKDLEKEAKDFYLTQAEKDAWEKDGKVQIKGHWFYR